MGLVIFPQGSQVGTLTKHCTNHQRVKVNWSLGVLSEQEGKKMYGKRKKEKERKNLKHTRLRFSLQQKTQKAD